MINELICEIKGLLNDEMDVHRSSMESWRQIRTRSERVLAPGAQDYLRISGHPDFPRFFVDACGHRVCDPEGKWYSDFYLGSGAVILGHGHPGQVDYVKRNLDHGATVSLRHPVEVVLAERLLDLIPCVDRFMFFKTGSECAHLALRTALKATGRPVVVSFGYHGWVTPFDHDLIRCAELRIVAPTWNLDSAVEAIRKTGESLAAVIVSPGPFATDPDFYRRLGQESRRVGGLFIMDEIKTGFRFKFPCLSVAFDLKPDLLLLAKAFSNGFPLAALGGREELLGDRNLVGIFSTFASENVALFATDYCVQALTEGAYEQFERASSLFHGLLSAALANTGVAVVGAPTFFRLELPEQVDLALVANRLAKRGLLFHPRDEVLLSAAHEDEALLSASAEAFTQVVREVLDEAHAGG